MISKLYLVYVFFQIHIEPAKEMCNTRRLPKREPESVLTVSAVETIRTELKSTSESIIEANQILSSSFSSTQKQSSENPNNILGTKGVVAPASSKRVKTKCHKRYFVQHKYVDHSSEIPEIYPTMRKQRGRSSIPFPLRMHQMLDDLEHGNLTSIASWRCHGRSFIVNNREDFVKKILPVYFQQHKFASFQRQLNLYGFSRISSGVDKGTYYHELFLRGRHLLTIGMTRTKVKGNAIRGSSNPYAEPDFYAMPTVGALNEDTLSKIFDFSYNVINHHMAQFLNDEIIKTFAEPPLNISQIASPDETTSNDISMVSDEDIEDN